MNSLTKLCNKIERRLGVTLITLPKDISKDTWPSIIEQDTLPTFSRYFPHKIRIMIDVRQPKKNGWYLIDSGLENYQIMGIGDIDFAHLGSVSGGEMGLGMGSGYFDYLSSGLTLDDVGLMQMRQNLCSIFNNNIFVEFELPNRVKFVTTNGVQVDKYLKYIPFEIFVQHPTNLMTIEPTKMETFEQLATCDIAIMLHSSLKMFNQIETVFGNVDLHLDRLEDYAGKRDEIVEKLESGYVSFSNKNQHMIMAV